MKTRRDVTPNMHRFVYKTLFFILLFEWTLGKSCSPHDLVGSGCPPDQDCDVATSTCRCSPGFEVHNDTLCVSVAPRDSRASTPNPSGLVGARHSGSIVAGILVPLFLILFVIYGVYVSRKYKLVAWFRRKIHRRDNSYDEFMIGQDQDLDDDDPPLR